MLCRAGDGPVDDSKVRSLVRPVPGSYLPADVKAVSMRTVCFNASVILPVGSGSFFVE